MTKSTALTPEQIACVYAWLAQLFSHELDTQKLAQIQSAEMADWFSTLKSEAALCTEVQLLESKIATLHVRHDAQLELAADFCSLFLMSDKQSALPYASVYPHMKQANEHVKCLLLEAGLQSHDAFNEPIDHLSIILELLSHLHFSSGELHLSLEKIEILRQKTLDMLLQWLPEFNAQCMRYDEFGFYSALSQLLYALVQLDQCPLNFVKPR
ncbi:MULTISPECIES: molecular chaperone TorD [Enterobacterales]|jgi:TorA-specific chaperone|uniref:Chaperone protein TorD n=4 Tax=Morganellaceae TaxID=1903414 RepID=A0A899NGR4_PROST|nr:MULTISPECIES: molecular chaperone TorD [Morganellaceae]QHP74613.1 molecular chaperone TorD [Proteus vulgaris]EKH6498580.1 molecular chaperone TorD [Providencia rettgeri]ELB1111407.1 molecular chaperone TorD [Morganella morganii]ELL8907233.1 molecular chaperone TorD [Proteus mirabilis]ELQ1458539.1 molecular chaperone TorD [Providencia rettgeri]